jgi:6-phosphofructokinase 1
MTGHGRAGNGDLDFTIARLGNCRIVSPMAGVRFIHDQDSVLYPSTLGDLKRLRPFGEEPPAMECAGPRERLFFDPSALACGIVTCGGLCPGVNDVIRAIVLSLYHHYGVHTIYGFRFGYEGLVERHGHKPLHLTFRRSESDPRDGRIDSRIVARSAGSRWPWGKRPAERLRIGILFPHRRRRDTARRCTRSEAAGHGLTISVIVAC